MKKELLKGFTMLMLVMVLALATAAVSANAQSAVQVVATIPFEFSVGYKAMPAGEYTVQTANSAGNALMIRSTDGKRAAVRLSDETERSKNHTPARLVFHRYGERYFLAEVWNGSDRTGRQLLKSQEESAIERELASNSANSCEKVEILAALR